MNKTEFINILSSELNRLSIADSADILYDYEEHFNIGLENGKSEDEIVESLGDPQAIAKQFNVDSMVKQASEASSVGNITRAVFATAGLGLFNLIFILGPYLGLVGVLIGLFASAFALTLSGVCLLLVTIAAPLAPQFVNLSGVDPTAIVFFSVGLTCLGMLFFMGVITLSKWFFKLTLEYLKMNMKIITK